VPNISFQEPAGKLRLPIRSRPGERSKSFFGFVSDGDMALDDRLRWSFPQSVMEACERILIAPQRQDEVCLVPTSCGAQTPVRVHQEVRGDMLRYRLADYLSGHQ
jgi:hypothetical protein